MKVGFQTILWGLWIDDIESVLDEIQAAGYQGVEFSQRPADIRRAAADGQEPKAVTIEELLLLLSRRGLEFLGLAGGPLEHRAEFCGTHRPRYLYVEDWTPPCRKLVQQADPFTVALHPHMYKPVHRLATAGRLLKSQQQLKFLPDTAHLTIAGDCPATAIRKWQHRLAAVHFKDWTPETGRSSFHYAKGFVPLGSGIVPLRECLKALEEYEESQPDSNLWVVVEQDHPGRFGIKESLHRSADWLRSYGVAMGNERDPSTATQVAPIPHAHNCPVSADFFKHMLDAANDSDRCHQIIAQAFHQLIPSDLVAVWKYSPAQDLLCLAGVAGESIQLSTTTMRGSESLSGETIDQTYVHCFDLTRDEIRTRFGDPRLLEHLDDSVRTMISIPIPNLWNKNHVWLLVNVFSRDRDLVISSDDLMRNYTEPVADALRITVEERCLRATTQTSYRAAQPLERVFQRSADDFLSVLCDLLQKLLECQAVHAFLISDDRDRLEHRAATGEIRWFDPDRRHYTKELGLTGKVWAENEGFLTLDWTDADREAHSTDIVPEPDRHETLFAPITRLGGTDVIGVIRCRNRNLPSTSHESSMFSDEDMAVVESVVYAAAPHLELLTANDARLAQMRKLGHELGKPLVAVRGAVHEIADDTNLVRTIRKAFPHDYLDDIVSWCDLMSRLLTKVSLNERVSSGILQLRPERTKLAADVIAPAARRLTATLKERGFMSNRVRRGSWSDRIPPLYVDRNMLQEVAFNLLDNAIKYAYKDPDAFHVEIDADETQGGFEVYFRDYGPGIPSALKERIFEEGFRGIDGEGVQAINKHVVGQGLGLWFVRSIVSAHGGTVYVSSLQFPTEFTVSLPKRLLSSKP